MKETIMIQDKYVSINVNYCRNDKERDCITMRVNYREIKDNQLQIQFQSQFFHLLPV